MRRWIETHPVGLALMLSLLFHAMAFVTLSLNRRWLFVHDALPTPDQEPFIVNFEDSPTDRTVIESPVAPGDPPKTAQHLSDKNVTARNPSSPENLPIGEAYAEGRSASGEYPSRASSGSGTPASAASPSKARGEPDDQDPSGTMPAPEFRREYLIEKHAGTENGSSLPSGARDMIDQRASRAPELGNFAINTYAWEYAPYLLWLKQRIEQNIFPPPAFTYMGIISGQTRLRFRIYPDGRMVNLAVLRSVGHKSLMETSVRAVELSVPLKPLPADFPENYLEVTALFEYVIQRP